MDLEKKNSLPEHAEISLGHDGVNQILEAVRTAFENALYSGREYFSWKEVEELLSGHSFRGYYWFRVMMFGKNATIEEEKKNPNGPASTHPGGKSTDDTGNFVLSSSDKEITEGNYQSLPLTITKKTEKLIYRI